MIKNDKQYIITKKKREEFSNTLNELLTSSDIDSFRSIMIDSIKSQIETFDNELLEYDKLKTDKPQIIVFNINDLPESLIKVRIIKGFSQSELAKKVGLKEQQIQRYELTNYESANFGRLLSIAHSLDISFEPSRLILRKDELIIDGYDSNFIKEATNKLHARRSLLAV